MLLPIGKVLRVIFGTGRQLSSSLNGQRDYKGGPFSQLGTNGNGTTALLDNTLTYCQPNPCPFEFIFPMQSFEHPENFPELF